MDPSIGKQQEAGAGAVGELREYRKGNWTVEETMVLIEAKRMDDERRMQKRAIMMGESSGSERGKPAELRWKWVKDYCWKNGCFRSHNQCNDKWDNLMRDFKKVWEYEGSRLAAASAADKLSYWKMGKNERKDNNLPSSMLPQVYEALVRAVVERKGGAQRSAAAIMERAAANIHALPLPTPAVHEAKSTSSVVRQPSIMPHTVQQQPVAQSPATIMPQAAQEPTEELEPPTSSTLPFTQSFPTAETEWSEDDSEESASKRRKKRGGQGSRSRRQPEAARASRWMQQQDQLDVGSAITRSASVIAEAIQSREDSEGRVQREVLGLHERRLQIEESKAEMSRQGINGLVDAINKVANSILAFAASQSTPSSK